VSGCETVVSSVGGATVAALSGELTLVNTERLARELEEALEGSGPELVLDLNGVTFLDSAGIQLLFRVSRLVGSRGGTLRLVIATDAPVYRVIRIVDPGGYVPLHPTRCAALAAVDVANA
jgi:anti-sigma B factor antagonist